MLAERVPYPGVDVVSRRKLGDGRPIQTRDMAAYDVAELRIPRRRPNRAGRVMMPKRVRFVDTPVVHEVQNWMDPFSQYQDRTIILGRVRSFQGAWPYLSRWDDLHHLVACKNQHGEQLCTLFMMQMLRASGAGSGPWDADLGESQDQ